MKDTCVMKKEAILKVVISVLVLGSLQFTTSDAFAAGTPGASSNETNPLQEISGNSANQQRSIGRVTGQNSSGSRSNQSSRVWAGKANVICTKGQVTLNLTGKNAQCPAGFVKK